MKLPRLTGPITLDGIVDEPAWKAIQPFPMVMYQPVYQGEVVERSEIRVGYDEDHIYMSGKLFTIGPTDVRGNSLYRDRWDGDDTFAIVLDTYNDNENALWFFTNPLGTRYDSEVAKDAEGDGSMNFDWNAHWDVATRITQEGWFAEFRIPFSTLRFQDEDGHVEMGLIVYRYLAESNSRYVFPDIPPDWNRGMNKPSMALDITLEGIYTKRPLYFTPYFLAGGAGLVEVESDGSRYVLDMERTLEAGLDLKYALTNNLVLDATINTDFAQVEADDAQINLTRFSLFFPEKRQFFQERSGIFDIRFGQDNRMFHSRRIGLHQGEPIRILGGVRMVGRVGRWDLGVLNMQTDASPALPAENFGVLRARRGIINPLSFAGAMVTTRVGDDGAYNFVYGGDATFYVGGDTYLNLRGAQSVDETFVSADSLDLLRASRLYFSIERRRLQGLVYDITFHRAGEDYLPGIGFENRQDFLFGFGEVQYHHYFPDQGRLRRFSIGIRGGGYQRNSDGIIETAFLTPNIGTESMAGYRLDLQLNSSYEDVREPFFLSGGILIPGDEYQFHELEVELNAPDGWRFRPGMELRAGSFFDGRKFTAEGNLTWVVNKHLSILPFYELNLLRFDDRGQSADVHLLRLRVNTALNNRLSLNSFIQFNSTADLVSLNSRFRFNISEGRDLWIVYDTGLYTNRDPLESYPDLRLPATSRRTFLLKYTHTFVR